MDEPLPFKEPPKLMTQTLNLALTADQCVELTIQGLDQIEAGEVKLRKAVADWLKDPDNGDLRQLAEKVDLHRNSEKSCLGHLKNVATRCRDLGMVEQQSYHKSKMSLTNDISVENPEVLSAILPTQRDVAAFKRLPADEQRAVASSTDNRTKAQQLLDAARARKAEAEKRWRESDLYKESRAKELAEGRVRLISQTFKEIGDGLKRILHLADKHSEQDQVRADLKRLANQLAAAGIYPDSMPNATDQ